jgi:hypothetical protein
MAEKIPPEKSKKARRMEEEYFIGKQTRKLTALRRRLNQERAEAEKKHLKELHWMRCPKCGQEMEEKEFRNIMIDQCKECGGIYFDSGELEMLVASTSSSFIQSLIESLGKRKSS